jgi:hypothetical protein
VETLNLILSSVAILGVAIIALLWKTYLPSYLKKKAEHLATKEDIGEITEQVKEVEAKYNVDLARLNAKLATACEVNSKQFELELRAYEQIWASLVRVRAAFLLHRSLARTDRQVSAEENDDKNYAALLQSLSSFNQIVENQRPFYSPGIWKSITELAEIISYEGTMDVGSRGYVVSLPNFEDKKAFREEKSAGSEKINKAIDGVCEAIRKRIFELANP